MPFTHAAVAFAALSVATSAAAQQHPPSGDELRSMYCVEVIRAEIDVQRHLISASDAAAAAATTATLRQQWIDTSAELLQGLETLESVRYRLQAYLLPRIPALDSLALATALRQGNADFIEWRALADRCAVECNPQQAASQRPPVCSEACGNQSTLARISACQKPAWLPPAARW